MPAIMCRVCLRKGCKMKSIENTSLYELYEKLTGKIGDAFSPPAICYICYSQLYRCWRFYETSRKTDQYWRDIANGFERTIEDFTSQNLSVTVTTVYEYSDNKDDQVLVTDVKDEQDCLEGKDNASETSNDDKPLITKDSTVVLVKYEDEGCRNGKMNVDKLHDLQDGRYNLYGITDKDVLSTQDRAYCETCRRPFITRNSHFEGSYRCLTCDISFKTAIELENHSKLLHVSDKSSFKGLANFFCDGEKPSHGDDLSSHFLSEISLENIMHNQEFDRSPSPSEVDLTLTVETLPLRFKCKKCPQQFTERSMLISHCKTAHARLLCTTCPKSFNKRSNFERHVESHKKSKRDKITYTCNVCQKTFSKMSNYKRHQDTHEDIVTKLERKIKTRPDKEIVLTCNTCQKSFNKKSNLIRHIRSHTRYKRHPCPVCSRHYSEPDSLVRHMRNHTGIKPFSCGVCYKSFAERSTYRSHMRTHTGEKPHFCSVCSKSFAESGTLVRHMRFHTDERPYKCNQCDKSFRQSSHYKSHLRTHSGEKPYICSVCSKSFTDRGNLNKHMKIHTGEKPHKCTICDKTFGMKNTLKTHILTHTGERPYKCHVCDKSLTRKSELNKHMLNHTGGKPLSCILCHKTFNQKSELVKHMRIHTGEKPFVCNICSKAFSESGNLTRHMRIHSGEKPYSCKICLKAFSMPFNLKTHLRTHTGESRPLEIKPASSKLFTVLS